jgi:small redox-active disulfide protein 2
MSPACCSPKGLRKIKVGDTVAGVTGLDELLETAFERGWQPEQPGLADHLVAGLRAAGNYVDRGSEPAYRETLLTIYRDFFEKKQKQGAPAIKESKRGGKMKIEILGPGCARCRATEANIRKALAELQVEAEVVHVSDVREIAKRGVMLTPGLVVDGKLVCKGRIPEVTEIKSWLAAVNA